MAKFHEPEILHRVPHMELDILKDIKEVCDGHHQKSSGGERRAKGWPKGLIYDGMA